MGVFKKAWVQGMTSANVIGCFRASGIYPIDRSVIQCQLQETEILGNPSSTPVPYVPFLTPKSPYPITCHTPARVSPFILPSTAQDSTLEAILRRPTPPVQHKKHEYCQGARVLTSEQCILEIAKKNERKQKLAEDKERRRVERQEKRQEKEEQKERRREEMARKKNITNQKNKGKRVAVILLLKFMNVIITHVLSNI